MKTILKLTFVLLFGLFTNQAMAQCNASYTAAQGSLTSIVFSNNSSTTITGSIIYSAEWDFGDGNSTTQTLYYLSPQSYTHPYSNTGTYNTRLIFTVLDSATNNVLCKDTAYQTVTVSFLCGGGTMSHTQSQNAVTFSTNNSPFSPAQITLAHDWYFGDGSSLLNQGSNIAYHTYLTTGTFNACVVKRYYTNSTPLLCADTVCSTVTVSSIASASCNASFTTNTTASPLISFTNTSTQNSNSPIIVFSSWDFGDGSTSSAINPSHLYNSVGTYNVCLITEVRDSATYAVLCQDTVCSNVTISVANNTPCEALFSGLRDTLNSSVIQYHFSSAPSYTGGGASITSYAWDFGDGNTSTSANPTHTYATPGQYNVCLTITSSNSCTDSYCMLMDVQPNNVLAPASYINGTVVPAPSIGAMVYLIEYNAVTQSLYAIGSQATMNWGPTQGYFSFGNVNSGAYLVKAAYHAFDPAYSTHLPTYYNASALWSGATNVTTTPTTPQAVTINMLSGTPASGPGFIGGSVLTGANKTTAVGDPKHKLNVLLFDVTNNQFVAVSRTDINGEYSFSGLANGTYKVFLEELGKTMTEADIVISATQANYPKVDFESNSTENHPMAPLSVNNIEKLSTYNLIGNPAKNEFSITGLTGSELVQILDLNGKVLKKFEQAGANNNFDITSFSSGIYIINIQSEQASKNFKLVIAK